MLLWVLFALLTAGAVLAISLPLYRRGKESNVSPASPAKTGDNKTGDDEDVYRAQLREVEAEEARGVLGAEEAEAARIEVSRRLLRAAGRQARTPPASTSPTLRRGLSLAMMVLVPALSVGLYLRFGSPQAPDAPLRARLEAPLTKQPVTELVARVEERLRTHPDDAMGWTVIAPVYMRLDRFNDAATAYARALQLKGESAGRLEGFGEAATLANDGIVNEQARRAFKRALQLEPNLPKSQFWIAMAAEQDGQFARAIGLYQKLMDKTPKDAPWRGLVTERLAMVRKQLAAGSGKPPAPAAGTAASPGGPSAAPKPGMASAPGPNQADIQNASKMSASERTAMINQMVSRLADRLKQDGSDLEGWLRLMRAYQVLGRTEDARKAIASAQQNFSANPAALQRIEEVARQLGIKS